ncbi:MAG: serine phosphatase RsbU (regulator of sigma subunit) [Crocinitomicaceae bacterium]|jgi:serine phosphatase RsbU (regulator of sigma subunit)
MLQSYKTITLLFLSLIFSLVSNQVYGIKSKKDITASTYQETEEKVDFILKIARNVISKNESTNKTYRIAIFGKNDEAKLLYTLLAQEELTIQNRTLEVVQFKRIRSVEDVDLIYLHKESNASLKEINTKVSKNCIAVTEDYPYNYSRINFSMKGGKLSYELHELELKKAGFIVSSLLMKNTSRVESESIWENKLEIAAKEILEKEKTITGQRELITSKAKQLKKKASKISSQKKDLKYKSDEIKAKKALIVEQNKLIISITIGAFVALILISFLLLLNKKRKQALAISELKTTEILASISYAKRIQNAFLPSRDLLNKSLKHGFIFYEPKDIVSGDFYWLEEHNGDTYFAVADCTGHGVPGALLSTLCSNTLTRTVNELGITEPGKILDTSVQLLDAFFSKGNEMVYDGMDIALCCLSQDNKLKFSGANRPLIVTRKDGRIEEIKGDRQPIVYYEKRKEYTTHEIDLASGDTLYLYSDGIPDQFGGERDKKFGSKRLKQLLLKIHALELDAQKNEFERVFNNWIGKSERNDDACLISVRIG